VLQIRPVRPDDVAAVEEAWHEAYAAMRSSHNLQAEPRTPNLVAAGRRRTAHLLASDPEGSWLAEDGGHVIGMAQSQIRRKRWVLSNLGVRPNRQEEGIGRKLLERTLDYGSKCSAGAIFSSPDPRAVRRYVHAGFELHPCVRALGPVRKEVAPPTGVERAGPDALAHVDAVDEVVRGDTRRADIEFQLSLGHELLVDSEGGYAVVRGGRIAQLTATDDAIGVRLIQAHLATCDRGQMVDVSWMRTPDQWAISVLSEAGVTLHVRGAVMIRGDWEMDGSYLPHGVFG
jgi:predicted N-acetyltransferase YhbS